MSYRIPLQLKFIILTIAIIIPSLGLYSYFAYNLFLEEQKASVYENGLVAVEAQARQLEVFLLSKARQAQFIANTMSRDHDSKTIDQILRQQPDVIQAVVYTLNKNELKRIYAYQGKKLREKPEMASMVLKATERNKKNLFLNPSPLKLTASEEVLGKHFSLATRPSDNYLVHFRLSSDSLLPTEEEKSYRSYLLSKTGEIIYPPLEEKKSSSLFKGIHQFFWKSAIGSGVREIDIESQSYLSAFSLIAQADLVLVRALPTTLAFQAADLLQKRSLWAAGFILALSSLLALFFTRGLTRPLYELFLGTKAIVRENFETKIKVRSNDEIGSVAESFNYMADEIRRYMEEMQEKNRLELELKTANLVQSNFIPPDQLRSDTLTISSSFSSATECGGDWWGHARFDEGDLVVLTDATGHGAAAALITASCYNALNTLEYFVREKGVPFSMRLCLEVFNTSLAAIGGSKLASGLFLFFNHQDKKLEYCNASHTPLFITKRKRENMEKNDLTILSDVGGPWLGKSSNETFEISQYAFSSEDIFFTYTDGLLENPNPQGKMLRKRELLKVLTSFNEDETDLFSKANDLWREHIQQNRLEDDTTFLTIGVTHDR